MSDELTAAAAAVDAAAAIVTAASDHLAGQAAEDGRISIARLDEHQVLGYDLAHAASAVEGCRVMLDYGAHGDLETRLACAFIADAVADLAARLVARDEVWGVDPVKLSPARDFAMAHRAPSFLEALADELPRHTTGPTH